MDIKEKVFTMISDNGLRSVGKAALMRRLGFASGFDRSVLDKVLAELEREGRLICIGAKYSIPEDAGLIRGKLSGNKKGFAFLICDGGGDDVFIPNKALSGAMHSDTVYIRLTDEENREGEVVSVIERGITRLVGTFMRSRHGAYVLPDEIKYYCDIFISDRNIKGAKSGQKVVVDITGYIPGKNPEGQVLEVIGTPDGLKTEVLSIIRAHDLYETFPDNVESASLRIPMAVPDAEIAGRKDFRNQAAITIDGADAKDFDDAVYVEFLQGQYKLYVHIADVAHYVKMNGAIDREALRRGTSVYFPGLVLPMLPKNISNGICSLIEGADRLVLTAVLTINAQGKVLSSEIVEGVIRSRRRMTYETCNAMLSGDVQLIQQYADVMSMLEHMRNLAYALKHKRDARGSIDFDIPECLISVDTADNVEIKPYERGEANRIIEEFMLAANEAVAEMAFFSQLPFVYRVHEKPSEEKMESLKLTAAGFGVRGLPPPGREIQSYMLKKLLESCADKPYYNVISRIALRSMQKARYHPENIGHFGLSAKHYCHFTAPIRRYPDLMVHRILKSFIRGGTAEMESYDGQVGLVADIGSERERGADEAEREVDNLYKAAYMASRIGESYTGIISGVTDFGVFVELANTCEGLVRVDNLPDKYYTFVADTYTLNGSSTQFTLGDEIEITVYSADIPSRRVEFVLAETTIGRE